MGKNNTIAILLILTSTLYARDLTSLLQRSLRFKNGYSYNQNIYKEDISLKYLIEEFNIKTRDELLKEIDRLRVSGLRGEIVDGLLDTNKKRSSAVDRILKTNESSYSAILITDFLDIGKLIQLGVQSNFLSRDEYNRLYSFIYPVLTSYKDLPALYAMGIYIKTGDDQLSSNLYSFLMYEHEIPEETNEFQNIDLDPNKVKKIESNHPFLKDNLFFNKSEGVKEEYRIRYEFHEAITIGDIGRVMSIYNEYKPADILFYNGNSAIFNAAVTNRVNYRVLRLLLELGYDPDLKNIYGYTPLLATAYHKNLYKHQLTLINYGADINLKHKDISPIIVAVERGNIRLINTLLERGAILTEQYGDGKHIVESALNRWSSDSGKRLIEELYKRDTVKDHGRVLNIIVNSMNREAFDLILSKYKNIDYLYDAKSPIYEVLTKDVKLRKYKIAELLKFNPSLKAPLPGGRPLLLEYIAAENRITKKNRIKNEYGKYIFELMSKSSYKDMFYEDETLLHYLSIYGSEEQILKCIDNYGPYKESEHNSYNILRYLTIKGFDRAFYKTLNHITVGNFRQQTGWSILGVVIVNGEYETKLKTLIEMGFDANVKGWEDRHIFSLLAKNEDYEMMFYLAEKGAKITNSRVITRFIPWNGVNKKASDALEKLRDMGAIINED